VLIRRYLPGKFAAIAGATMATILMPELISSRNSERYHHEKFCIMIQAFMHAHTNAHVVYYFNSVTISFIAIFNGTNSNTFMAVEHFIINTDNST
jgi:hypothetical protein